jgi:hypothetical protein
MVPVGMGLLCDSWTRVQEVTQTDFGKKEQWSVKVKFFSPTPHIHNLFPLASRIAENVTEAQLARWVQDN